MSAEFSSGPRVVAEASVQLAECPYSVLDPNNFTNFIEDGDIYEAERLRYFAMGKVVSDRLAATLPQMKEKFPPYGLPDLYRDRDMDSPEWRPMTRLEPDEKWGGAKPMFTALRQAYVSKMIVHMFSELDVMYEEDALRPIIDQLSVHRMPNYHINTERPPEEAYDRLGSQTSNAIEVVVGIAAILPEVAQPTATPEELVAIFKSSKRIAMQLSTLSFKQFQALLIETTSKERRHAAWGWDFDPRYFKISTSSSGNKVIAFVDGVKNLPVAANYRFNHGEDGASLVPDLVISEQEKIPVGHITNGKIPFGCPSIELTGVMWDDMGSIIEELNLYSQAA